MKNPFTLIKAAFTKIAGRKDQVNKPQDELDRERKTIEIPEHRTHRRKRNHMRHQAEDRARKRRQDRRRPGSQHDDIRSQCPYLLPLNLHRLIALQRGPPTVDCHSIGFEKS